MNSTDSSSARNIRYAPPKADTLDFRSIREKYALADRGTRFGAACMRIRDRVAAVVAA